MATTDYSAIEQNATQMKDLFMKFQKMTLRVGKVEGEIRTKFFKDLNNTALDMERKESRFGHELELIRKRGVPLSGNPLCAPRKDNNMFRGRGKGDLNTGLDPV